MIHITPFLFSLLLLLLPFNVDARVPLAEGAVPGERCGDAVGQFCGAGESCCYRRDRGGGGQEVSSLSDLGEFQPRYERVLTHCCKAAQPVCCGRGCCSVDDICVKDCASFASFCVAASPLRLKPALEVYNSPSHCAGECCGQNRCCEKCCGEVCMARTSSCCLDTSHRDTRTTSTAVFAKVAQPPLTCPAPRSTCCGEACCQKGSDCCEACTSSNETVHWTAQYSFGLSLQNPHVLTRSTPDSTVCCGGCSCCDLVMSMCMPDGEVQCVPRVLGAVLVLFHVVTVGSWVFVATVLYYFLFRGVNILAPRRRRGSKGHTPGNTFFFSPSSSYSAVSYTSAYESDYASSSDGEHHESIGFKCASCHHPAHHKTQPCNVGAVNISLSCISCQDYCRRKTCHKSLHCSQQYSNQKQRGGSKNASKTYEVVTFDVVNSICPCPVCTCCTCMPILNCACRDCACPECTPFYAHYPPHLVGLLLHAFLLELFTLYIIAHISLRTYQILFAAAAMYFLACLVLVYTANKRATVKLT